MNTASKTRHVFILFLADIVWGIAFVAQSKGGMQLEHFHSTASASLLVRSAFCRS